MPILATRQQILTESTPRDWYNLEFRSIDGTDIIRWGGDERICLTDVAGIDVAPLSVTRDEQAGQDGSYIVPGGIRYQERDNIVIPVWLRPRSGLGPDVRAALEHLQSLATAFEDADYDILDGTFDLVGSTSTSGERRLRVAYLEGLEGDYSQPGAYPKWRITSVHLLAVDPDCIGESWSIGPVKVEAGEVFLSDSDSDGWPRALSSTLAIGDAMPLTIPGNRPTPALVTLLGPADAGTRIASPSGLDVTLKAIPEGKLFVLDTGRHSSATLDGADAWDLVVSAKQGWLRPGATTMTISMSGTDDNTAAWVSGFARWRTLW